jgi:NAD(P)-dependent dehydrogenase (short-subunit alcohol dehydrogenase family)
MTSAGQQVILVAGASSGIGRAAAVALSARGHRVFGTSRDPSWVGMRGVDPVALEVTNDESVTRCVGEIIERAGRIDVVVYSAGFYVAGAAEETSPALATEQFEAYLFGAHRIVRAVLPTMRKQGCGRLIFMSSSAAVAAIPFHAFYSASKAALEHYADALRYEVEPFGIRVTCIQGTSVRTGAVAAARTAAPSITAYDPARTRVVARFQQTQRQGPAPTAFAAASVHATETRRLGPHYRVGAMAKTLPLLRHLLPDPIFRPLFGRTFDLGRASIRAIYDGPRAMPQQP